MSAGILVLDGIQGGTDRVHRKEDSREIVTGSAYRSPKEDTAMKKTIYKEETTMKKQFTRISALGFATALTAAFLCGNVYAGDNAGPGGVTTQDTAAFSPANHGQVLCTAFINSNGSVAGGQDVNKAINTRIGVGTYNVKFTGPCSGNIRVNNGWARWTQVDTLQFGTTNGHCTTADLAATSGVGAIWVNCFSNTGAPADRSFSIFVAR